MGWDGESLSCLSGSLVKVQKGLVTTQVVTTQKGCRWHRALEEAMLLNCLQSTGQSPGSLINKNPLLNVTSPKAERHWDILQYEKAEILFLFFSTKTLLTEHILRTQNVRMGCVCH